ncbi:MAG: hypothetical protein ABSD29_10170 [Verrucomicrobiota bacterium]|jgi:hypothetical protein
MNQAKQYLINTPLQRGGNRCAVLVNRFNGFSHLGQTVETVSNAAHPSSMLKRGVNESRLLAGSQGVKYPS